MFKNAHRETVQANQVRFLFLPSLVTHVVVIVFVGVSQMNHGLGCRVNSCNRWFDKTIQFIIGPDGAVGANYEHCSAEGPPILAIIDHAMNYV